MKTILDQDRLDLAKLFTGIGVEVGVAEGWYSNEIMKLGNVTKMYGVDPYVPHQGYRDYTRENTYNRLKTKAHERLDKYPNYEFIEEMSLDAVDRFKNNSLDFVYIDGDHSNEAVSIDLTYWSMKVKPGGLLAGDDYIRSARDKRFYDVIGAVDEYVAVKSIPELLLFVAGRNPTNWMFYKP